LALPITATLPDDAPRPEGGGGAADGVGTQAARSAAATTAMAAVLMEAVLMEAVLMEARRREAEVTIVGGDRLRDEGG
jgi:hypothetical protein